MLLICYNGKYNKYFPGDPKTSLLDKNFKCSYESREDDLISDFYIPALSSAQSYDRIAGFFSSSSLSIASEGIAGLIINKGHMRLLACPILSPQDITIIKEATAESASFFSSKMLSSIEEIETDFQRDHLQALGWMLKNGFLEIKIVQVLDENGSTTDDLFHQKVGVIKDFDNNKLSFSGSINESASGWLSNIEEFKVFQSWLPGQEEFITSDEKKFNAYWNGERPYAKVIDLPSAVREKIIKFGEDFDKEKFITKHYIQKKKKNTIDDNLSLFDYQESAVNKWIENNYSLLFEMATGTGKTRTALACVNQLLKKQSKLIVIFACPEATLASQWKTNEVEPAGFDVDMIIADGTHKWRGELSNQIDLIVAGFSSYLFVFTTHATASSEDFISTINRVSNEINICFVGDEAHGLGASKTKKALLERYNYRIGLSATPSRWFDDIGTKKLVDFFGNNSFSFNLHDALTHYNPITRKPFLVLYDYKPFFVSLDDDELERYIQLSDKIAKLASYGESSDEYQDRFERLCFLRADIHKNASQKLPVLRSLLTKLINEKNIKHTIIFVSPEQKSDVMKMTQELGIFAHEFTEKQKTSSSVKYNGLSEREFILQQFREGTYEVLVAISCLDEGIDIPVADKAILLASSTNPREYVQRIGRVIRQAPNKNNAYIYDIIVAPNEDIRIPDCIRKFEKRIFKKEMDRVRDMAYNSRNRLEVMDEIARRLNGD